MAISALLQTLTNSPEQPASEPEPLRSAPKQSHSAPEQSPLGTASKNRINLLGMSLLQRNLTGDIAELTRLLALVGVTINCIPGAGSGVTQLRNIANADLNVVIHPEYGIQTAQRLNQLFGTPMYLQHGLPIGFEATEQWISAISARLNLDPTPALDDSAKARARAYAFISRVHSITGLPRGVPFAVEGTYSELLGYTRFCTDYLGMTPDRLQVLHSAADTVKTPLLTYLAELNINNVLGEIDTTQAEIILASGNTIARLKAAGKQFSGVETRLPSLGYLDVIPKTHLGITGALQLSELLLNSLPF
jgi:nitrogenase molybdenum-iron protein alpha/beta subunit